MPVSIAGPKFYVFDSNGDPVVGAKINTYEIDGVTRKETFNGEDGEANSNPVVTNSSGYADVYLDGVYAVVVTDADDSLIWSENPVTSGNQLAQLWTNKRTAVFASTSSFTVNGNATSVFLPGRRVKIEDSTDLYGVITASSYSSPSTTVTVSVDGAIALSASVAYAWVSFLDGEQNAFSHKKFESLIGNAGVSDLVYSINNGTAHAALNELFQVNSYSADSPKHPATWKCTSVNASLPASAVAGDVTGTALGSLYVLKTGSTYYRFEHVGVRNVLAFGATGDGSTDDTAAIQAAINSCPLDDTQNNYKHTSVFIPTPEVGYVVTGLNCYQRVEIRGESKWNTRLMISNAGDYGFCSPHLISNVYFDGVAIANGTNRIDQAGWTRAADRANTGVIMGPSDESFEAGHGIVKECRFNALGVAVERGNSVNTSVRDCYISACWHGIFNRATTFASMMEDHKNYITGLSGIGIGFYISASGYNQYSFDGTAIENCCTNAAHYGINGFFDTNGASIKGDPSGRNVYFENDGGTYPNSIAIRGALANLNGVFWQGFDRILKSDNTSAYWQVRNGEVISATGTYDLVFPTGSGRSLFENVTFDNGLDSTALGFTTLINCNNSGVLPDGNSNYHMDDGELYVGNQGAVPAVFNRRSDDGDMLRLQQAGTLNLSIASDVTASIIANREAGGLRLNGRNSDGVDGQTIIYRKNATATNLLFTGNSNVTSNDTTHLRVYTDGDIENTNGTYGTISDRRVKTDIQDANSQWDDFLNIRFRKFRKIAEIEAIAEAKQPGKVVEVENLARQLREEADSLSKQAKAAKLRIKRDSSEEDIREVVEAIGSARNAERLASYAQGDCERVKHLSTIDEAPLLLGAITQELEEAGMGGLVNKRGEYDSLKMSILFMKGMVALQEAMRRIEKLENKI